VTAYCDPDASHALSLDWTSAPSGDALCPITSSLAARFIWSTDPGQTGTASGNPSYEPFGQLQARIAPGTPAASGGYRVNYTYDLSRQGGVDYGLPTTVAAAAPITQADNTQRQPAQNFWYDNNGCLGCYNKGAGTWVLAYDALGRPLSTADPDDSAAGAGICGKTGGTPGWSTAATTAYFPDGSVLSKQSASQRATGVSTTFTYDLDGNESTETHHFGCVSVSSCTPGVTHKWYDGADRLVEVALPFDAYDIQGYPMMTRYIYDLSQSNTTPYQGLGLRGYGNPRQDAGASLGDHHHTVHVRDLLVVYSVSDLQRRVDRRPGDVVRRARSRAVVVRSRVCEPTQNDEYLRRRLAGRRIGAAGSADVGDAGDERSEAVHL
ncbi:MAG: hypothetical protein M3N13_01505, partial [Candidatus Eremiobacteraeota bacterium]|nr:hypothetical protein [Candidatus Eremiobacteraeota bacterium]